MLSEGVKKILFTTHLQHHLTKRAGTERGTSSIIKSGQKDTEASIHCETQTVCCTCRGSEGMTDQISISLKLLIFLD